MLVVPARAERKPFRSVVHFLPCTASRGSMAASWPKAGRLAGLTIDLLDRHRPSLGPRYMGRAPFRTIPATVSAASSSEGGDVAKVHAVIDVFISYAREDRARVAALDAVTGLRRG